ncbi:MAG: hypothetical protein Alpg2KO_18300 [Alphaproteobacteria bacterium]
MNRLVHILMLFIALCLPAPLPAKDGTGGLGPTRMLIQRADDRKPVEVTPGSPFNALLKINAVRIGVQGTGFMIGKCHALTNRHVVMARGGGGIHGHIVITRGEARHQGTIVTHGQSWDTEDDWALLKLDPCVEDGTPPVRVSLLDPRTIITSNLALISAGFPHDKDQSILWIDPWCTPKGLLQGPLLAQTCPLGSGNSGGPMILQRESRGERLTASAINAAIVTEDRHGGSELVRGAGDPFRVGISIPLVSLIDKLHPHVPDIETTGRKPADWPPVDLGRHDLRQINKDLILNLARQGNRRAVMEVCIEPEKYNVRTQRERAQHCRTLGLIIRADAEAGDHERQLIMGWLLQTGLGGRQDQGEAVEWYRKAAAQGNDMAAYNLGLAYLEGNGVAVNRDAGIRLLRHAVDLGSVEAEEALQHALRLRLQP